MNVCGRNHERTRCPRRTAILVALPWGGAVCRGSRRRRCLGGAPVRILCLLLAMVAQARPWTAKQVDEFHLRHVCWLVGQPDGERAVVTGANWEGLDMIQGWFERAVLVHVNFNHATLWDCNFNDCDLRGADFSRANLGRSTFLNADLRGANFTGADLFCIELAGAKLDGANFKKARHWPS